MLTFRSVGSKIILPITVNNQEVLKMQFREKGKKILCIRTEYRPEAKRTVGVTIASFDKYESVAPDEVRQKLRDDEASQLSDWLNERTKNRSVDGLKSSLSTVAFSASRASKALTVESIKNGLSTEDADEIWGAISELSRALRKAGFKKPTPTKTKG